MRYFSEKTEGLITFQELKKPNGKLVYAVMFAFLLLIALICLFPIIWVALSALKTPEEMYSVPPTFLPSGVNLGGVVEELENVNFLRYFRNTLFIMAGVWVCDIVFNGISGYVLSRIKPIGSHLLETVIFWSMLLPGISMAPLYMSLVEVKLVGSFIPIWLMAGCNAFNIMLFRNFFNSIPMDYIEAARIDGCTNIGIFAKIIMPLSKPIVVVVSIFNILGSWGNFFWPYLLLGSTDKEPMSVFLYQLTNGIFNMLENEVMAVAMLAIIPPMVIYAFMSKYITGGINMSGIKG